MNRVRESRVGFESRAKYLRRESGVMQAVHVGEVVAANDGCQPERSAPERCEFTRSGVRETRQKALKALARNSLRADGLSMGDAAVACDRQEQHVRDMLSPDGRNMSADDVVAIAILSPSFRAGMAEMMRIDGAKEKP